MHSILRQDSMSDVCNRDGALCLCLGEAEDMVYILFLLTALRGSKLLSQALTLNFSLQTSETELSAASAAQHVTLSGVPWKTSAPSHLMCRTLLGEMSHLCFQKNIQFVDAAQSVMHRCHLNSISCQPATSQGPLFSLQMSTWHEHRILPLDDRACSVYSPLGYVSL